MNTQRVMIAAVLLVVILLATYFVAPRTVVVYTGGGTRAGLQVSLIRDVSEVRTVTTDSKGVAAFGSGPWSPPFGKPRTVALKVQRDGKIVWDGIITEAPRLGAIRISVP